MHDLDKFYSEIPKIKELLNKKIESFNLYYEKCLEWDEITAKETIQSIPKHINKMHKLYMNMSKILFNVKEKYDIIYQEKYIYYKTDYDIHLKDAEIKTFINSDTQYVEVKMLISEIETFLDILEKAIKNIDNLRWDIKNYLDWLKFQNGI